MAQSQRSGHTACLAQPSGKALRETRALCLSWNGGCASHSASPPGCPPRTPSYLSARVTPVEHQREMCRQCWQQPHPLRVCVAVPTVCDMPLGHSTGPSQAPRTPPPMSWALCLLICGRCLQDRARGGPAPSVRPALRTPPVQRLARAPAPAPARSPHSHSHSQSPAPAPLGVLAPDLQLAPGAVSAAESGHRTSYSVCVLRIDSAESTSDSSALEAEAYKQHP